MRTRSSSKLVGESSPNPTSSNPKRRNRRRSKQPFILKESPVDRMADQRTMAELLRAPTEGYIEAIVVPSILAEHFELKHSLINMMSSTNSSDLKKTILMITSIAKLTHAVNQQTSVVTTAMTAILKQFQATPPPASVKAIEEIYVTCGGAHPYYQCLVADGNTFSAFRDNIQGYVSVAAVNYNQVVPLSELEKIKKINEINIKAMQTQINNVKIELRNEMKTSIQASMSNQTNELKNMMASFFQMNTTSTSGSGPLPSNTIANPKEEDERVEENLMDPKLVEFTIKGPLILGRPFLRTARALIDVHGEETSLRDGDERLTLNMRRDTSSYSNQPQKKSINMINIYNDSYEDYLKDLFATNHLSGNPTFSSRTDLTSPEVINPLSGSTTSSSSPDHLLEEFADELALITFPSGNDDLPFDIESDLREIEYLLNHDPTKEMDSILEDSIDKDNLADHNDNLFDTIPEMFTDEHALDYSSSPLYDDFYDDLDDFESDDDDAYNDPFDCKGDKIKESKLLIDELDSPRSSDFLPSPEYDSFLFEDFSEVDDLPSTNNDDKVFNPGILIHENLSEVTVQATPDKNVTKIATSHAFLILEDFDPPIYELSFHKEVPGSENLLLFSFKIEERVFNPEILTFKGVHTSLLLVLSHQGPKTFKVIKIFESPMEIFPCFFGEDIRILDVPCLHFYPP
nr:hypothetical protein [Tanacetum cinerariifolium]